MYLTSNAVVDAIKSLRATTHPFLGITFLACKAYGLSVGSTNQVSLDKITRMHMEMHHKLDMRSAHFFQPFKGSANWWVAEKYPSSGLQTVNTQTFLSAFIHPRNTRRWGFSSDYIEKIEKIHKERGLSLPVPADALAVWIYKDEPLDGIENVDSLVSLFFKEFNINDDEKDRLFSDRSFIEGTLNQNLFSTEPLEMNSVLDELPAPPDAHTEGGKTILSLSLNNIGPASKLKIDYGSRLTIITGDNGLGKSFLLDFTWWAATGLWVERPYLPNTVRSFPSPEMEYTLLGADDRVYTHKSKFNQTKNEWSRSDQENTVDALAVFSRADGSFAISDPRRSAFNQSTLSNGSLAAHEVWNGRPGLIEGLIRDWVRWQSSPDRKLFDRFSAVLKRLSPDDLGILRPGDPIRIPGDPREIPTVEHHYGTIPVTQASSGVQRVLLLAYLIIWSWQEHELASQSLNTKPLHRMLVVVDELEAHLHPKWQRIVLPALLGIGDLLSSDLALQVVAASHSPMILASMEADFDIYTDLLFHLYGDGPTVKLEETPFVKYGDATGWLTSPLFGLKHARSREAEKAIEEAKSLQLEDNPSSERVSNVSERLKRHLAPDDKFWPRWLYFAEKHGVKL